MTIQARPTSTARRVASSKVTIASTARTIIVGENGSTYSMRSETTSQFHITQACGAAAATAQAQSGRLGRRIGEALRAGYSRNSGGTKTSRWKPRMVIGSGKPKPPK